jgi:hypothetical protein
MTDQQVDKEVLAAVFAARVQLAKKTEVEVVSEARREYATCVVWVNSNSQKEKSFLWFCDEFDLDPGAVRRAIQEKR